MSIMVKFPIFLFSALFLVGESGLHHITGRKQVIEDQDNLSPHYLRNSHSESNRLDTAITQDVNGTKIYPFEWNSNNDRLRPRYGQNRTVHGKVVTFYYLTLTINSTSILRLNCPVNNGEAQFDDSSFKYKSAIEYTSIYVVFHKEFDECKVTRDSEFVGKCLGRGFIDVDLSQYYSPLDRDVYFISTSTGLYQGINKKRNGLCRTHTLKLHVSMPFNPEFDMESEEIHTATMNFDENAVEIHDDISNERQFEDEEDSKVVELKEQKWGGSMIYHGPRNYGTDQEGDLSKAKRVPEVVMPQFDSNDYGEGIFTNSRKHEPFFTSQDEPTKAEEEKRAEFVKTLEFIFDKKQTYNDDDFPLEKTISYKNSLLKSSALHGKLFLTTKMVQITQIPDTPPNPLAQLTSTYDRVRIFDAPFTYLIINKEVENYCSYCLQPPATGKKLMKCAACEFACYCNKECQKLAWKTHRGECKRLKNVFPNLPLTEVLFLSRVIDKVLFIERHGDHYGWEANRKFGELMSHEDDIRKDPKKVEHFKKLLTKMETFRKEEMIDADKFFDIFCRTSINSHSIHTNAGTEVGMALDLGVSLYNHSCRPNCSLVFEGFKVCIRPLTQSTNPYDYNTSFISYTDVGRSRYQRRKDLRIKWYFECMCERCMDPEDDLLTSLKCKNAECDEPIITHEVAELKDIECPKCKTIADAEYVKKGQEVMIATPPSFDPSWKVESIAELLTTAEEILHDRNIYISRLKTAVMHMNGTLHGNVEFVQKQVYENFKMCFPAMDRHNGFQLINIVKSLIENDQREEAIPYAFDAMTIFEVCFGMNHPYYLQTLALWTYLEKQMPKTNAELFSLMNFDSNISVDISQYVRDIHLDQNDPSKVSTETTASA
uniref:MYND-type domain-containing protein n=1 Tax=Rhabditophanes sp. KR3021 TaxID=114890 RepID=A0AC35U879_9BILA